MAVVGAILLVAGLIGLAWSASLDTTIPGGAYGSGRVHNLGLMNEKQNLIIIIGTVTVLGGILVVAGRHRA